MSIFLPYTPTIVLNYFTSLFSIDFSNLTSFETATLTLLSNLYFFAYWFFIIYFSLKIFTRLYERLF